MFSNPMMAATDYYQAIKQASRDLIWHSPALTTNSECNSGTFHFSSSGTGNNFCCLIAPAWVTLGVTCTPVVRRMLLRLEPVKDLTSDVEMDSKNFTAGLADLRMVLTNLTNLVISIIFRFVPETSSRIHLWVAQGRS